METKRRVQQIKPVSLPVKMLSTPPVSEGSTERAKNVFPCSPAAAASLSVSDNDNKQMGRDEMSEATLSSAFSPRYPSHLAADVTPPGSSAATTTCSCTSICSSGAF